LSCRLRERPGNGTPGTERTKRWRGNRGPRSIANQTTAYRPLVGWSPNQTCEIEPSPPFAGDLSVCGATVNGVDCKRFVRPPTVPPRSIANSESSDQRGSAWISNVSCATTVVIDSQGKLGGESSRSVQVLWNSRSSRFGIGVHALLERAFKSLRNTHPRCLVERAVSEREAETASVLVDQSARDTQRQHG
jgi:hypothetical protein